MNRDGDGEVGRQPVSRWRFLTDMVKRGHMVKR